jgi:hypothetical protein
MLRSVVRRKGDVIPTADDQDELGPDEDDKKLPR